MRLLTMAVCVSVLMSATIAAQVVVVTAPVGGSHTSDTSLSVSTGSKTVVSQIAPSVQIGDLFKITRVADANVWMFGLVTGRSATSVTVNVLAVKGSGTFADWNVEYWRSNVITPQMFGAKADSSDGIAGTDDTVAIQDAADASFASQVPLYFPRGRNKLNYKYSGDITIRYTVFADQFAQLRTNVDASIIYGMTGAEGSSSGVQRQHMVSFPQIRKTSRTWTSGNIGTKAGLVIRELFYSTVFVPLIQNFSVGLECATTGGVNYNNFHVGLISSCGIGLKLNKTSSVIHANTNNWFGPRFQWGSGMGDVFLAAGTRHIALVNADTSGSLNDNKFYGPSFEGYSPEWDVFLQGTVDNAMIGANIEASLGADPDIVTCRLEPSPGGVSSARNMVIGGNGVDQLLFTSADASSSANFSVAPRIGAFHTINQNQTGDPGATHHPPFRFTSTFSNNNPVIGVYGVGNASNNWVRVVSVDLVNDTFTTEASITSSLNTPVNFVVQGGASIMWDNAGVSTAVDGTGVTDYWIRSVSGNTYSISAAHGGAVMDLITANTGRLFVRLGSAGFTVGLGPTQTMWKSATDFEPRVKVENSTGRLYLGSGGATAPTAYLVGSTNLITLGDANLRVQTGRLIEHSVGANITAASPGNQGDALLINEFNIVKTVGAPNDAVTLPGAVLGRSVTIINKGANTLEIWPSAGHDLGNGLNIADTLAAGATATYLAVSSTAWVRL